VRDPLPAAADRPRLIGVGTAWRGDDAAGLAVARQLGGLAHEGDAIALIDAWAGARRVILVDAAASGAPPGTVHHFDAAVPLPARAMRSSTHALGVPEAIELGRALGQLPARLEVYAIEGGDFTLGAELTPPVAVAVERLARTLAGAASIHR
jgi:hydrogenase maturation protease